MICMNLSLRPSLRRTTTVVVVRCVPRWSQLRFNGCPEYFLIFVLEA